VDDGDSLRDIFESPQLTEVLRCGAGGRVRWYVIALRGAGRFGGCGDCDDHLRARYGV